MILEKYPETVVAACLENVNRLPVGLMSQDEARFGRMSDPRSCWAPAPYRPGGDGGKQGSNEELNQLAVD